MKITIQAEQNGIETIDNIITALKAANISVIAADIKTEVQNKEGKWVNFEPTKIKFTYSK